MDSYKRPEHIELTADQSRDKTLLSMYRQIIDNPASRSLKSKPSQPIQLPELMENQLIRFDFATNFFLKYKYVSTTFGGKFKTNKLVFFYFL